MQNKHATDVSLTPVAADNWRQVAGLRVQPDQRQFVAETTYYLCLCHYGQLWQPLAICQADQPIGFLMWAIDTDDNSCWLGGVLIDKGHQRRGLGRAAMSLAIQELSARCNPSGFALSYSPANHAAQRLYASLGFVETGEMEDEEIVARLQ